MQLQMQDILTTSDRRKDEFLATLAHELRNPLAPMRNAAYILRDEVLSCEKQQWARAVMERQVAHMTRLMDVARIRRGAIDLRRGDSGSHRCGPGSIVASLL